MAIPDSRVNSSSGSLSGSGADTNRLSIIDWLSLALMIIGGINWGLVGAFNFDLVAFLFGVMTPLSRIVYILVGVAALYGIVLAIRLGSRR